MFPWTLLKSLFLVNVKARVYHVKVDFLNVSATFNFTEKCLHGGSFLRNILDFSAATLQENVLVVFWRYY